MTHKELRIRFKDFFKKEGYQWVESASLLPKDDPSVLLTTAGMQQFKPYFVGLKDPKADFNNRVASIQKCFRTADIDEVGDETHLTFFEMMGNFGFNGQVSKEMAIQLAWEFLTDTKWMGIDKERISVTYYNGSRAGTREDSVSKQILDKLYAEGGVAAVTAQSDESNFWGPTGDEGPCGPTVEFYVDGVEVWNIVFNEYYHQADGSLTDTSDNLGVDTGMGFERLLMTVNKLNNVFETDVFTPVIKLVQTLPEKSQRVIADHARGIVFLMADHIRPSNKAEGYILRRILRRLLLHIRGTNVRLEELIETIIDEFSEFYPELKTEKDDILKSAREEADKFGRTIDAGERELNRILSTKDKLTGEEAFNLFSSFGLPIDFIKEKIEVDEREFEEAFDKHRQVSRAGVESKFGGHGLSAGTKLGDEDKQKITQLHTATHLLHEALKHILGEEVHQAGSDINPTRARFDFLFPRKLEEGEIRRIEDWVNQKIKNGFKVKKETMPYTKAIEIGAHAFFKEKYPDTVDVYTIYNKVSGDIISCEVCGGPHVASSKELGKFKIIKEQSSSAGIRRIKAILE
ncbi:alanine--tRNA ligase [candidate division Kazan bacterium]|uniref:alanine--tRNA ligase n=1 Tax=candidate division Kazan bacterium TaxID=2202143 RepID=A0A420ZDP0_UNCK3|nr:MAG: alanine--tRNA ligase [candidate division Kazan bacterium]